MLTLKASVVIAILAGTIATTVGITYVVARTGVTVSCSAPTAAPAVSGTSDKPWSLPSGPKPQLKGGKEW
jgi:hypothetical protein